jgi:transcriptional regulator with XRE-family HTH domain
MNHASGSWLAASHGETPQMTNASDEIIAIKRFMREKTAERLKEVGTNYSEISKLMGAPKSTLSEIFNSKSSRLPSIYTLLKLARALDVSAFSLLPPYLFNADDQLSKTQPRIQPHNQLSLIDVTQSILKYGMNNTIYYHPRNLPEFIKPKKLLLDETNISKKNADSYINALNYFFERQFKGKILIDELSLIDLMDRKGAFSNLSRLECVQTIELLKKFADQNLEGVKIHVGNRHIDRLDPILILSDTAAISDYFQTLMFVDNYKLIEIARNKIERSCENNPSLLEWLSKT